MCLRESNYLETGNILHTSISGTPLHPGLIQFTVAANRKRSYRLMKTFLGESIVEDTCDTTSKPVFITNEEFQKSSAIENQTIAEIDKMIISLLESHDDHDIRCMYMARYKKDVSRKKKAVHVAFFNELLEALEDSFQAIDLNLDEL